MRNIFKQCVDVVEILLFIDELKRRKKNHRSFNVFYHYFANDHYFSHFHTFSPCRRQRRRQQHHHLSTM